MMKHTLSATVYI